jgi:hypothetical protein
MLFVLFLLLLPFVWALGHNESGINTKYVISLLMLLRVSFVALAPVVDAWKSQRELLWIRNNSKASVHVFGRDTSNETFIYCFKGHEHQ